MKDYVLFAGGTKIGTIRADNISGEGNFTKMESYGLDDRSPDIDPQDPDYQTKRALIIEFQKLPYHLGEIIEFATENNLTLAVYDGANKAPVEYLVGGINITTSSPLPSGVDDIVYEEEIEAEGGSDDFVFEVITGSLPDGLTLASDGTLSGTPTETGLFTFTVQATDVEFGFNAIQEFNLTIDED